MTEPPEPISVRACTPDHARDAADVFLTARARCMPWLPKVRADDDVRNWIATVLCRRPEVWVAGVDGRVVGFAALREDHLDHLYVHPEHHGRGVGTALLRHAIRRCPGGLKLWVFQQNVQARRFYEYHGFVLLRETDGHENEERTPDALYGWTPALTPSPSGRGLG